MMVVDRMLAFLKRNRRKFVLMSSLLGGGWLLYTFVWKRIKKIKEEEDKQLLFLFKRQHHFESNQRTCNMTVLAMIPNLRETLTRALDTDSITELLKTNPPNKLDLWEELKVLSVTRCLAAVYGVCMLSIMLRVQLNIIGGYLYLDSLAAISDHKKCESSSPCSVSNKIQEKYLSLIKHFIEKGFVDFIHFLKSAVTKEVGYLSLKEPLTLDNIISVLDHVRERVECGVDKQTQSLYPYLLTSEEVPDFSSVPDAEDQLLQKLISETRDILESNDFHSVLKESIDRGYHSILDGVASHYKLHLSPELNSGLHSISIALAKLIPVISSLMFQICGDSPNQFLQELLLMEELKQLAANIYEAFSQGPDFHK